MGTAVVVLRDHQPLRDGTDTPLDNTGVVVEDEAFDARIPQQGLQKRQTDGIVCTQQLLHELEFVNYGTRVTARPLTRLPANLCSLVFRRVKPIGRSFGRPAGKSGDLRGARGGCRSGASGPHAVS